MFSYLLFPFHDFSSGVLFFFFFFRFFTIFPFSSSLENIPFSFSLLSVKTPSVLAFISPWGWMYSLTGTSPFVRPSHVTRATNYLVNDDHLT